MWVTFVWIQSERMRFSLFRNLIILCSIWMLNREHKEILLQNKGICKHELSSIPQTTAQQSGIFTQTDRKERRRRQTLVLKWQYWTAGHFAEHVVRLLFCFVLFCSAAHSKLGAQQFTATTTTHTLRLNYSHTSSLSPDKATGYILLMQYLFSGFFFFFFFKESYFLLQSLISRLWTVANHYVKCLLEH